MKTLNGWQRIFVLLSLGWLMFCIGFAVENWPTENNYRAGVSIRASQAVPDAFVNRQAMQDCSSRKLREGGFHPLDECSVEGVAGVKPEDKNRYDALIAEGESQMGRDLLQDRATLSGVSLGAWLGGSVAFYICVLALYRVFRWVVAGFRGTAP